MVVKSILLAYPDSLKIIIGSLIVVTVAILALIAPVVAPYDPTKSIGTPFTPPSREYILGTDHLGFDVLSRIIWGARTVLQVVISATLVALIVGVALGAISGYYGGIIDRVLSMIMDSLYAFPSLILAIAIAAVLGPSPYNATIAISVVYIPIYYRMVKGQTLAVKAQLFVDAARASGVRDRTIIVYYILPNIAHTILVVMSLNIADAILTEAGLSFSGLTVSPPTPDWGFDLRVGQRFLLLGYWWLSVFPGLAIMILALGFALIGEGLSDRFQIRTIR
ncbi:MAG: ABC transporter permease [Acidilobaceae archaeon]